MWAKADLYIDLLQSPADGFRYASNIHITFATGSSSGDGEEAIFGRQLILEAMFCIKCLGYPFF